MPNVDELKQSLVQVFSADEAAPVAHRMVELLEHLIEAKIEEANFKPSLSRPAEPKA